MSLPRLHAATIRSKRNLKTDDDAAVSVEAALVTLPFMGLLLLIIEAAILFFMEGALDSATTAGARAIRTGQISTFWSQNSCDNDIAKAALRRHICDRLTLFDCEQIHIDARVYSAPNAWPAFRDAQEKRAQCITNATPLSNAACGPDTFNPDDGAAPDARPFAPGKPSDVMQLRVFYDQNVLFPDIARFFTGQGSPFAVNGGRARRFLISKTFQSEPFIFFSTC